MFDNTVQIGRYSNGAIRYKVNRPVFSRQTIWFEDGWIAFQDCATCNGDGYVVNDKGWHDLCATCQFKHNPRDYHLLRKRVEAIEKQLKKEMKAFKVEHGRNATDVDFLSHPLVVEYRLIIKQLWEYVEPEYYPIGE